MATLVAQTVPAIAGRNMTFAAAAGGGDKTKPGSGVFLFVRNGDASSITVTLVTPGVSFNNTAIADTVVTVPAGATWCIPVPMEYRNPSDGLASITYSAVTSVTVAVLTI